MANDDSWRFKRAEELGLIDTGPVVLAPRPVRATVTPAASPPPAAPSPPAMMPDPATPTPATPSTHPSVEQNSLQQEAAPPPKAAQRAALPVRAVPAPAPRAAAPPPRRTAAPTPWLPALAVALALMAAAAAGWFGHTLVERYTPLAASAPAPVSAVRNPPVAARTPRRLPVATTPPASSPSVPPARSATRPDRPPSTAVRQRPVTDAARPLPRTPAVPATGRQTGRHGRTAPLADRGATFAPSFNCRRASASVNRMICADRDLAALDVEMAQSYRRAVRETGFERQLDTDQAAFLNARARCQSENCIARIYRQRIDDLDDVLPR